MKKILVFMVFMFSLSIFGQVVVSTNPFEVQDLTPYEPVTITDPNNGTLYIDPCSTTQNACVFNVHSSCIYDGLGEYHCECSDGYKHSDEDDDKSTCIDTCSSGACDVYGNDVECSRHLVEGKGICLQKSDNIADECINDPQSSSCGGVLLCSEENLNGVCKVFTESTNNFDLIWYNNNTGVMNSLPKSAKPINSNWEIYAAKESRFASGYGLFHFTDSSSEYSNNNILNFNTNETDEVSVFVIQPINKAIFKAFHGEASPYISLEYRGLYDHIYYRQVFSSLKAFNTEHFLPKFGINYVEKDDNLKLEGLTTNNGYISVVENSELSSIEYLNAIVSSKTEDDISEGLIICGEDNANNFECKSIKRMAWKFISSTGEIENKSSNWPIFGDETNLITRVDDLSKVNTIYLHEGWEAFVCNGSYDDITDCKVVNPEETYSRFTNIDGSLTEPKLLIVQAKTPEKLEEVFGDIPYAILYDEPNFNGNHIIVYKDDTETFKRYPNPIKNPKSVYNNKKGLKLYLNKGAIVKRAAPYYVPLYNLIYDKFINTTDSTPWDIENKNVDKYYTISTYTNTDYIYNEGVRIKEVDALGIESESYYQKRHVFSGYNVKRIQDITDFKIYPDWEVYLCKDEEKNNCEYFNEYDSFDDIKSKYGEYSEIKYMLVQPANHRKVNQFYGHSEHDECGNGLKTYVEIYKNKITSKCVNSICDQRELLFKDSEIGVDTIIKPNEIQSIRVVGIPGNVRVSFDFSHRNLSSTKRLFKNNNINIHSYLRYGKGYYDYYDNVNLIKRVVIQSFVPLSYPTILVSDTEDFPSWGFGYGMYIYAHEDFGREFYSSKSGIDPQFWTDWVDLWSPDSPNYIPGDAIKTKLSMFQEDKSQNKDMDSADLNFIVAHGNWFYSQPGTGSHGSLLSVLGKGKAQFYNYNASLEQGGSIGDYETEWLLTTACESLGTMACLDDTDYFYCNNTYPITNEMVINAYREHFANGLHGFGGMYDISVWPATYSNDYAEFGETFWEKVNQGKSIAEAWVKTTYYDKGPINRYSGYIAPGHCLSYTNNGKTIYSYIHNDHFWTKGRTLRDPSKKFIKENGFCYFSGANGNYPNYLFDDVITNSNSNNWIILNSNDYLQNTLDDEIYTRIINYIDNKKSKTIKRGNFIQYDNTNYNNFLSVNNTSNTMLATVDYPKDDIVEIFYSKVMVVYNDLFQDIIKRYDYNINNVSSYFILDQHFNNEAIKDSKANLYEINFKFSLSINNNNFMDNNYIIIGVNPMTGNITNIESKILAVEKSKTEIDYRKIDNDFNELNDNKYNYYKGYTKKNSVYYPMIARINKKDGVVDTIKTYGEEL